MINTIPYNTKVLITIIKSFIPEPQVGANIEWESSNFQSVAAALILNLAILHRDIN
jgi:hypothetical protein